MSHAEQVAGNLERALVNGNADQIETTLAQESRANPDEFKNICKEWEKMNAKDVAANRMLPKLELDCGLLGLEGVKDIKVDVPTPTWHGVAHNTVDVYDTNNEQFTKLNQMSDQVIGGIQPQQEVNCNDPLRNIWNMFTAPKGYTSKINEGGQDDAIHTYNGQELPKAKFGGWR